MYNICYINKYMIKVRQGYPTKIIYNKFTKEIKDFDKVMDEMFKTHIIKKNDFDDPLKDIYILDLPLSCCDYKDGRYVLHGDCEPYSEMYVQKHMQFIKYNNNGTTTESRTCKKFCDGSCDRNISVEEMIRLKNKTIKNFYEQFEDFSCYIYHCNDLSKFLYQKDEYPTINMFIVSFGDLEALTQLIYEDILIYKKRYHRCYEALIYKGHFNDLPVYECCCGS